MSRWQQVSRLYNDALKRAEDERAAFLQEACGDDRGLRREVESLLAQERNVEGFLTGPVMDVAARFIQDEPNTSMIGKQIGGYQILSLLGTGGMGEVYRARDTTLGRDVAIKVLPRFFVSDPDRLARLTREARLLASLNHPHIATIHGLEEADGVRALVMELVEGPTLADTLALASRSSVKAGLPLAEVLKIGGQIAEALEAAHERGIIHRDLKPANIKITHDGHVKVLDFGLATAVASDGTGSDVSHLPTLTASGLQLGAIVGTPAYMSPEQARGQTVDKRTDIWAFGCVLYEMLTGRAVFPGATISDTIAAILEREPQWDALAAQTPAGIGQLLRRCLDKDPKRRLRDIGDARIEIDDVRHGREQDGRVAQMPARPRRKLAWASVMAFLATAAATSAWLLRPTPVAPEVRLEINAPPTRDGSIALSPDGLKIVFAARPQGQSRLWLRTLDSPEARPLPGTEGGVFPFWSPNSRAIGFFTDDGRQLKRLDIAEGSVRLLASTPAPRGGAWGKDDTIIFSPNPGSPIVRIAAGGGELVVATRFESPQGEQSFPVFLPDGRHFLFFVTGSPEARGVYIGQLDGLETRRLFEADSPATYGATGHLLFIRDGKLLAQDFDPVRLEPRGEPFPIAEHLSRGTTLSASAAGPIAYRAPATDSGRRQLVWVDRSGLETETVMYPDTAAQGPALSRDGRRVAVFRMMNGNVDIWTYETGRRTWERVTIDSSDDIYPLWSADGTRIVFGSNRNGGRLNLYRKVLGTAPGSEELLFPTTQRTFPMDWSPDGRFLLYDSLDPKRGMDVWAVPLEGGRTPFEVVQTDFSERLAQFSPDGTWIAYESDKTGHFEIYVQPFPGPGDDSRVSIDGGAQVRWNPNGKELFYIAPDDRLMAVPIRFLPNGKTVELGTPLGLFATNVGTGAVNTNRQQYMVAQDGRSFVLNSVVGEASTSPITVILNWKPRR